MSVETFPIKDRAEWLRWRHDDVTASVVGALFNCHPYVTALRLFREKSSAFVESPEADSGVLRRGRWFEPAVAKAVSEKRPEWKLVPSTTYFRDTTLRLGATPDFLIDGDPRGVGVLQCKTASRAAYRDHWQDGDDVPQWIAVQCLAEMMLTGAAFGAIACLLVDEFNPDVAIHDVERRPDLERLIGNRVIHFWTDVRDGRAPDPDFVRDDTIIRGMYPQESKGKALDLSGNNHIPEMLAQRARLKAAITAQEAVVDEIESELRFVIGDAEIATGIPGFHVTCKTVDRKAYSVDAKSSRQLRIYDRRPPGERPVLNVE